MFKERLSRILVVLVLLILAGAAIGFISRGATAASTLTSYYTMLGYEGIPTIGTNLGTHGQAPFAGDYVSTHCRYINVQNTTVGQYYLRYPLHLPNGANISKVEARVADFYSGGSMFVSLRSRPWNSRESGDLLGFTLSPVGGTGNDELLTISGLDIDINNGSTSYWLDFSPQNSSDPGQLCVYSIRVTYTIDGVYLPLIQQGY